MRWLGRIRRSHARLAIPVVVASLVLMAPSCTPKLSPDWVGTVSIDRHSFEINEAATCQGTQTTTYARQQANASSMLTWAGDEQKTTCKYFGPQPGGGDCTFVTQVEMAKTTGVDAELTVTKDDIGPGYHVSVSPLGSGNDAYLGERTNACFSQSYDAFLERGPFDIPLGAPDALTGGWSAVVIDLCALGSTSCDFETTLLTATVNVTPIA